MCTKMYEDVDLLIAFGGQDECKYALNISTCLWPDNEMKNGLFKDNPVQHNDNVQKYKELGIDGRTQKTAFDNTKVQLLQGIKFTTSNTDIKHMM